MNEANKMENLNVKNANRKLFYAVVAPFQGNGEPKLILHEAIINEKSEVEYGDKDTLIVNPDSVLLFKSS